MALSIDAFQVYDTSHARYFISECEGKFNKSIVGLQMAEGMCASVWHPFHISLKGFDTDIGKHN